MKLMKAQFWNPVRSLLCGALLLAGVSCSSSMHDQSTAPVKPGAIAVSTNTALATVVAVDAGARTVTLQRDGGGERTYHCGRDVVNFNQIMVGDRVNATITDSVAIFLRKSNDPPFEGHATAVALAPRGSRPGVVMASTMELDARILAIDQTAGTITIETPEEMTTLLVGPNIDLSRFRKGEDVTLRVSEAIALLVEAPR